MDVSSDTAEMHLLLFQLIIITIKVFRKYKILSIGTILVYAGTHTIHINVFLTIMTEIKV